MSAVLTAPPLTASNSIFAIKGPRSRQILQKLTTDCDLSNEAFPFSTNKYLNIAGHKVRSSSQLFAIWYFNSASCTFPIFVQPGNKGDKT